MKTNLFRTLRLLLPALVLFSAACRKNNDPTAGDPLDPSIYDVSDPGITGVGIDDTDLAGREGIAGMNPIDALYDAVYFGYDSSAVSSGEVSKVQMVARYMNSNPRTAVILQGNTDERGSREYNLALGERRALAVRELMLSMGVDASRIQTLSFGEEQPAVPGFDESAWSMNRRVEFQLMQ